MLARLTPSPGSPDLVERWAAFRASDELIAPHLLLAECTSVLSEWVHRRRIEAPDARRLVEDTLRLPIRLIHTPACYFRAYDIARSLGWAKAYDALYLAVAALEDGELLTMDGGMHKAAARLSIPATLVAG